jgi:4-hydroxy-tetrahydrodipicolinate reductase
VPVAADMGNRLADCDVAIDFSQPSAAAAHVAACCAAGKPLLIGTTGLAGPMLQELDRAARHIPLLVAANTSLGITLLAELVRQCAQVLPGHFDIEILETHHRGKRDAPSGTALALGRAAAEARGQVLDQVGVFARTGGESARREGEIGFAVVRGGDVVGEHTVLFAGSGEQLILSHRATDRAVFARGALDAALWLAAPGRAPGRYSMRDILF